MSNVSGVYIKQLEEILSEIDIFLEKTKNGNNESTYILAEAHNKILLAKAAISRIAGTTSEYYKQLEQLLGQYQNNSTIYSVSLASGSVKALLSDLKSGNMASLPELIRSEVFSDFLEMSEYLLSEGYKDAAAVIAGSTLEAHLRELCLKNSISTEYTNQNGEKKPKKAETLNTDLANSVISKLDQKQVTAWLGIRNDAAHGNYDNYTQEQVKLLVMGIRNFIIRTPA